MVVGGGQFLVVARGEDEDGRRREMSRVPRTEDLEPNCLTARVTATKDLARGETRSRLTDQA
jgi:hypothetical protein